VGARKTLIDAVTVTDTVTVAYISTITDSVAVE